MATNATNKGGSRTLVPPGNYKARCFSVIHIGTIDEVISGEMKTRNLVRIAWEIPELEIIIEEGKPGVPMTISQEYTLSTKENANLRKMLQSWRGKDFTEAEIECFDVNTVAGACCMLNIIHKKSAKGNLYEVITSVSKLPKELKCPPAHHSKIIWDYDSFDRDKLELLPEYVREKIKKSVEYKKAVDPTNTDITGPSSFINDQEDDDLPF